MRGITHSFLGMPVVAISQPMRKLMNTVKMIAGSSATVLIEGERGTGKESIGRALHCLSERAAGPWVNLSCAVLPDARLEAELFGRMGMFERAGGGTLYLDEIGDLEMSLQSRLPQFLDYRPTQPLVRLIASTSQSLEDAVVAGRFRADLFHRLSQFRVVAPPLRDRMEDIIPLAEHFLESAGRDLKITDDAKRTLELYPWPGNIRELQNVLNLSAAGVRGQFVRTLNLPERLQDHYAELPEEDNDLKRLYQSVHSELDAGGGAMLQNMEMRLILQVVEHTGGHRERAANLLGISRLDLSRKLRQHDGDRRLHDGT